MLKGWTGAVALLLALAGIAPAVSAADLASLDSPGLVGIRSAGFAVANDATVRIHAVGREATREEWRDGGDHWVFHWGDDDDDLTAYAWIIDADTRETVWEMEARDTEPGETGDLVEVDTEIPLPAGRYEVYLTSNHAGLGASQDGDWLRPSMRRRMEEIEEEVGKLGVEVTADVPASQVSRFEPSGEREGAVLAITGVGDSEVHRRGFSLDREVRLQLFGLMEYPAGSDGPADFGWIVDLDSGERIWDMSDRRGRHAGGAQKNRQLDRNLELGPGRYMLVYGTDDSHSAAGFNAAPPHDPLAWGVQLIADADARRAVKPIDIPSRGEAVVDFSGAGDDEFFEQAFRMKRDGQVHIYALGEGVDDGWTWVDYGWIIDAGTGETVWSMDDRNTFYAGGADKNRMFDGSVALASGDYILFYVTDGSHSREEFNAAAPFEPDAWGLQLFADGNLELIDADEIAAEEGVLVSITRVRDNDRVRERFSLDRDTRLLVHCVGEGAGREMYDYGWIRDLDSRRVVWEMDYRETDHAGGAQKNREVRAEITLPAGEYEVIYETDGSHSFGDWNDRQPSNPHQWGITVRRAD